MPFVLNLHNKFVLKCNLHTLVQSKNRVLFFFFSYLNYLADTATLNIWVNKLYATYTYGIGLIFSDSILCSSGVKILQASESSSERTKCIWVPQKTSKMSLSYASGSRAPCNNNLMVKSSMEKYYNNNLKASKSSSSEGTKFIWELQKASRISFICSGIARILVPWNNSVNGSHVPRNLPSHPPRIYGCHLTTNIGSDLSIWG